jgi:alpha-L-arabinofuranosidase
MVKYEIAKLSTIVLTIGIMASTALIIVPTNLAHGQGFIEDLFGNTTQANTTQANTTQANTTQANTTQGDTNQGNASQGNLAVVIDVDTLSENIKERHPILAQMAGNEDQDLIIKIKGMDSKEAAKTTIALNILRLLEDYKRLDVE